LTHKFSLVFEQLKGENRHVLTHIFSVQLVAPFSHAQGCANGPFHGATKNYVTEHNTARKAHLHDDMKGYVAETDAIFPFSGKPLATKNGPMLQRKVIWQDQPNANGANLLNRLTYSQQAENLSVGKTKSYWTNNTKMLA